MHSDKVLGCLALVPGRGGVSGWQAVGASRLAIAQAVCAGMSGVRRMEVKRASASPARNGRLGPTDRLRFCLMFRDIFPVAIRGGLGLHRADGLDGIEAPVLLGKVAGEAVLPLLQLLDQDPGVRGS